MTTRRQKSFWVWFFISVLKLIGWGALCVGASVGIIALLMWVISNGIVFTVCAFALFFVVLGTIIAYFYWEEEVKR